MNISVQFITDLAASKATSSVIFTTPEKVDSYFSTWNVAASAQNEFKGEKGEQLIWYPESNHSIKKITFIGLGNSPTIQKISSAVRTYFHTLKQKENEQIVRVELPGIFSFQKELHFSIVAAGLGWEPMIHYKKKMDSISQLHLEFFCEIESNEYILISQNAIKTAEIKKLVSDWVNMPTNYLGPKEFSEIIEKHAQRLKLTCIIIEDNELHDKGFGAIYAVGKGSSNRPRLIKLEYTPSSYSKHVALIGKGVMFDTGGVSIKGSTNLHYMKCDMGGASIALGSLLLAAELELPVKITAIVPTVMNMLDASSYLPGDVLTAYNGLSIEVIDTDAEGRLVLADALAYASQDVKPDIMLDFATLTGAAVTALGYHSAALMSKNETLVNELIQAGNSSGDRVWSLPLWDEYGEPLSSDVADVKNYAGPASGAIFAGKFLEKFTNDHTAWAHIDVAGMVLQQGPFGKDRVATGYGVELVTEFLKQL